MTTWVDEPPNPRPEHSMDTPDAIEFASRDEISALQLGRLQWSLQHAYENVPHYRKAFQVRGVHPDGSEATV